MILPEPARQGTCRHSPAGDGPFPARAVRFRRGWSEVFTFTPVLVSGVALSVCGISLALWTRRSWCDPLIDFGVQLYVPWQLAAGKVLYRDLAWYNGPLSAYLNSVLFRLTGPSLLALSLLNLGVVAVICSLLYALLRASAGLVAAFFGCLFFLGVHAFGQLLDIANYNFVNPYYHDVTHGILLGLTALFSLRRWRLTTRAVWLVAAGLLTGLAFLTKAEVFLAVAAAVLGDFWLSLRRTTGSRSATGFSLLIFGAGFMAPVAAAYCAFRVALPASGAALATTGAWRPVLQEQLIHLPFFRNLLGINDLTDNVILMGRVSLWYFTGFALLGWLALRLRRRGPWMRALDFSLVVLALGALRAGWTPVPFNLVARPLPVAMSASAIIWLWIGVRRNGSDVAGARNDAILSFSLSVFALVLLAKIFFSARLAHYGFALSMPAAVVSVAALTGWIPQLIQSHGGRGSLFRWVAGACVTVVILGALSRTDWWLQAKTVEVGRGGDTFRSDWRGAYLNRALEKIDELVGPDQSLLVLPEGAMLNYLARRVNPTPYTNFMPTELTIYGENRVLDSIVRHPPDWIVLVDKDTADFALQGFGIDYGQSIMRWVQANYRPVLEMGATPLGEGHGMLLLRRPDRLGASLHEDACPSPALASQEALPS